LPFLFVLMPSLLTDASWIEFVFNFGRVLVGIGLGTMAAVGTALAPPK
jgi:hypothetical protein